MGIPIHSSVDAVDDRIRDYGAGAKLYWGRDNTSAAGVFTDASGNTALVAGQSTYELYDATGQTGHYYRTRVGNAAATDFSAWSTVFRAGELQAYASVDSLREMLNLPDDSRDNFLADCLRRASGWLDQETGRDFYRHPQVTGTETRTYNVSSDGSTITDDIISITTIEYATATGGLYTALVATDWSLTPPGSAPYSAAYLTDTGLLSTFYAGYGTVRITGVFGYLTVPALIEQATLDLARELYQQGPGGRTVGVDFGRMPLSVQRAVDKYRRGPSFVFA